MKQRLQGRPCVAVHPKFRRQNSFLTTLLHLLKSYRVAVTVWYPQVKRSGTRGSYAGNIHLILKNFCQHIRNDLVAFVRRMQTIVG
jgi:hypothetical protein